MISRTLWLLTESWTNKMNSKSKFNKKHFRIGACHTLSNIHLTPGATKCTFKAMLYRWCLAYIWLMWYLNQKVGDLDQRHISWYICVNLHGSNLQDISLVKIEQLKHNSDTLLMFSPAYKLNFKILWVLVWYWYNIRLNKWLHLGIAFMI